MRKMYTVNVENDDFVMWIGQYLLTEGPAIAAI
jgi:hypothetical protein